MNRFFPLTVASVVLAITSTGFVSNASAQALPTPVTATPAAGEKLIEITAMYVLMSPEEVEKRGLVESPQPGDSGPFKRAVLKNGQRMTAADLHMTGDAMIVTAPRIRTRNNLKAELRSSTMRPVDLTIMQGDGQPTSNVVTWQIGGESRRVESTLWSNTSMGLTVTPSLQKDGTVTLQLNPGAHIQLINMSWPVQDPMKRSEQVLLERDACEDQTLANLKFDETVALLGANYATIGGTFMPGHEPRNAVIFVTARLVDKDGN